MKIAKFVTATIGLSMCFSVPADADYIDLYCKEEALISARAVLVYSLSFSKDGNQNRRNRERILDDALTEIKGTFGSNSKVVGQMLQSVQNSIDGADDELVQRGYRPMSQDEAVGIAKFLQNSFYRGCLQRAAKIR